MSQLLDSLKNMRFDSPGGQRKLDCDLLVGHAPETAHFKNLPSHGRHFLQGMGQLLLQFLFRQPFPELVCGRRIAICYMDHFLLVNFVFPKQIDESRSGYPKKLDADVQIFREVLPVFPAFYESQLSGLFGDEGRSCLAQNKKVDPLVKGIVDVIKHQDISFFYGGNRIQSAAVFNGIKSNLGKLIFSFYNYFLAAFMQGNDLSPPDKGARQPGRQHNFPF
jgi:hypothetical protein